MSTNAVVSFPSATPPRSLRAAERTFYAGMVLLLWATVLFGFTKTYFGAGMVRAPLPARIIHIHGAVMSLWMIFLLVQTALITTKNVRVHRALGSYGFLLAILMCMLGPLAAVNAMHRGSAPMGTTPLQFFIVPVTSILLFAIFIAWSWRARMQPQAHKRLILLGTIAIMDAAVGRWNIAVLQAHPPLMGLVILSFVALMMLWDLISLRKIHRTTAIGFAMIAVVSFARIPLGATHPWQVFAGWVARTL